MPGILSLDPSTRLGWAYAEPGEAPTWGNERLGRKGAGAGEVGAALCVFLEARLTLFRPLWVIYEAPFVPPNPNAQTLRRLFGLPFLIDTICEQHGVEAREVMTMAFTKYFTGSWLFPGKDYVARRKAKKAATIRECAARGWTATEDEADALALLCYAESILYAQEARRRPVTPGPLFAGMTT